MKYDDASWHYGGNFPEGSPEEYGGTHIGLFLRYCFTKGWASELHTEDVPDLVNAVVNGSMSGTDFLFEQCDGKFTDQDLNEAGNMIAEKYYGNKGHYFEDYSVHFGDLLYQAPETDHDFTQFYEMFEKRLISGQLSPQHSQSKTAHGFDLHDSKGDSLKS